MLISSTQVKPGDVIQFLGRPHLVERIDDYTGPFDFITGVARAANGWSISLEANVMLDISRVDALVSAGA